MTQHFGENRTCVTSGNGRKQVSTVVEGAACPSGQTPLYRSRGLRGHTGIDLAAAAGQPVYAAHAGRVWELETELDRGIGVGIISGRSYDFPSGRFHAKTRYWHLTAYAVKEGDRVRTGQLIGWAGSTGLASGPHLHFELKPVVRVARGSYRNADPENGYRGAIDPAGYVERFEPTA